MNYQLINWNTKVRKVLEEATDLAAHFISYDAGTDYRTEVKFGDLDILLENENLDFITADGDKALTKPTLVLYSNYSGVMLPANGILAVEFQFMVNNNDLVLLDAFTSLCRILCNLSEEENRWFRRGLLPKRDQRTGQIEYTEFEVQDGSKIYPDLRNKIILRSIQCNFFITGELSHGY